MSLKAGRVGVNPADVDPVSGHINSSSTDAYTKAQSDDKFLSKTSASLMYESKSDASTAHNLLQPKTLAIPIEMLSGTKLTVETALQGLNSELTEMATVEEYAVSSSFTLDDSFKSVFKIGRIAFANIRITDISQATAYSTAICSLPAAVRPMKLTRLSILAGGNPIGAAVDTYGSIIPNVEINNGNAIICASWIVS